MQSFRGGTVNDFVPSVRILESRWRGKVKFWRSRKKPGVMDFLQKLMGDEILSPFYLACDPEGWFLSGQLLDVPLALSFLSRYHAFKILVLKSDTATIANVSSFLVLRLNSNTALR